MIIPVIMCGGAGTRLWPLSRELHPKQFLPLVSDMTVFQETLLRLEGLSDLEKPIIVCNESHRFMALEQLRQINQEPESIILEPFGRNTAPAVALSALSVIEENPEALLLVLPADHFIGKPELFRKAVEAGVQYAEKGNLVTFGIVPTGPETGYGYIRKGAGFAADMAFSVDAFVEKPDFQRAVSYLASGDYLWNSGMFLFKASEFLAELSRFRPEVREACQRACGAVSQDNHFLRVDTEAFAESPSVSIDYAVMEQTEKAVVVPMDAQWSDIGSWSALHEIGEGDQNNNVCIGDVMTHDSHDCYIKSSSKLVATVGMSNCIVVETADSLLVADKESVQNVKEIVNRLNREGRPETIVHPRVDRPWGSYECIDKAKRYQVKRITVNPGSALSLQRHFHRSEHWIIVKGTALVTRDDETVLISENESIYIPLGAMHRLENPGKIPLELIEVQSGAYLGEDDIVRVEDQYGRSDNGNC